MLKVTPSEFATFHASFYKSAITDTRTGFKRCNGARFGQAFINAFVQDGDDSNYSKLWNEENPKIAQKIILITLLNQSQSQPLAGNAVITKVWDAIANKNKKRSEANNLVSFFCN